MRGNMDSKNGIVSVIILYYNQPDFVMYAIESVLNQNYGKIELFIADDNSRSFPHEAVEKYIAKKKGDHLCNYIYHHNEINLGTVKNINQAIGLTTGEYIKIFAADDALYDEYVLTEQVKGIKDGNTLIVTGYLQQCDAAMNVCVDRSASNNQKRLKKVLTMPNRKRGRYIYRHNLFPYVTQSMLFKRDYFKRFGLYRDDYLLIEDTPMMWRLIDTDTHVGLIDRYVIKHRGNVGVTKKGGGNPKSASYYSDCVKLLAERKTRREGLLSKIDCFVQMKMFQIKLMDAKAQKLDKPVPHRVKLMSYKVLYGILHPVRALWQLVE